MENTGVSNKYEKVEKEIRKGEVIRNLNGTDYSVEEILSPQNLLLKNTKSNMYNVAINTEFFARYPQGEDVHSPNCEYGIEWGHGDYLNLSELTIEQLEDIRNEYGDGVKRDSVLLSEGGMKLELIADEVISKNENWIQVATKQVKDSDDFFTDYTMYQNIETGGYGFIFGDNEIYTPDSSDFDYECDTEEEAWSWYNSYKGFDEDEIVELAYYTKNLGGTGRNEDTQIVRHPDFSSALTAYLEAVADGKEIGYAIGNKEFQLAYFSTTLMKNIYHSYTYGDFSDLSANEIVELDDNYQLMVRELRRDNTYNDMVQGFEAIAMNGAMVGLIRSNDEWGTWLGRIANAHRPQDYVDVDITGYRRTHEVTCEVKVVHANDVVHAKSISFQADLENFEKSVRDGFATIRSEFLEYFKGTAIEMLDTDEGYAMITYATDMEHTLEEHYERLGNLGYDEFPNANEYFNELHSKRILELADEIDSLAKKYDIYSYRDTVGPGNEFENATEHIYYIADKISEGDVSAYITEFEDLLQDVELEEQQVIQRLVAELKKYAQNNTLDVVDDVSKKAVHEFRSKTDKKFQQVDGLTAFDMEMAVREYIEEAIKKNDIQAEIVDVVLYGSRARGLEKADSDIDFVVEYKGQIREDVLFDILHEDSPLINSIPIPVDINPIRAEETGTLEEYLPKAETYLEVKELAIIMDEAMWDIDPFGYHDAVDNLQDESANLVQFITEQILDGKAQSYIDEFTDNLEGEDEPEKQELYRNIVEKLKQFDFKKRLFADIDGTLAEFKTVDTLETLYEEGYFFNLEPHENVVDAVKEIMKNHPEVEVFIMSSVLSDSKYALAEKNAWLDKYLPEIDMEHRIYPPCGDNKLDYVPGGIRETDHLLDDYTKNLVLWQPPAKGIKLLNGINHTHSTWTDNRLDFQKDAKTLANDIVSIMNGNQIMDLSPQESQDIDDMITSVVEMEFSDILAKQAELAEQISALHRALDGSSGNIKMRDKSERVDEILQINSIYSYNAIQIEVDNRVLSKSDISINERFRKYSTEELKEALDKLNASEKALNEAPEITQNLRTKM